MRRYFKEGRSIKPAFNNLPRFRMSRTPDWQRRAPYFHSVYKTRGSGSVLCWPPPKTQPRRFRRPKPRFHSFPPAEDVIPTDPDELPRRSPRNNAFPEIPRSPRFENTVAQRRWLTAPVKLPPFQIWFGASFPRTRLIAGCFCRRWQKGGIDSVLVWLFTIRGGLGSRSSNEQNRSSR